MKKFYVTTISSIIALGVSLNALGADSGEQFLENAIGASDAYRISCGGGTDHLKFGIIDNTPSTNSPASKILNLHIEKKNSAAVADVGAVAPGETEELSLADGNGKYKLVVNSSGTTPTSQKQSFTLTYGCLNSVGQPTKPSSFRTKSMKLKANKQKNFTVNCKTGKTTGDTSQLYAQLKNTTIDISKVVLNAQVIAGNSALNTTDTNGDSFYSNDINVIGSSGPYTVLVNSTAANNPSQDTRVYSFQASCLNASNQDNGTATIETIQNQ